MPYLPNCTFEKLTAEQFLEAQAAKHLAITLTPPSALGVRSLATLQLSVRAEYAEARLVSKTHH